MTSTLTIARTRTSLADAPTAGRRRRRPARTAISRQQEAEQQPGREEQPAADVAAYGSLPSFLNAAMSAATSFTGTGFGIGPALRVFLRIHPASAARGRDLRLLLLAAAGGHHLAQAEAALFFFGSSAFSVFFSSVFAVPPVSPAEPGVTVAMSAIGIGL